MKRVTVSPTFHPFLGWGSMLYDHLTRQKTLVFGEGHAEKARERADEINRRWEAR